VYSGKKSIIDGNNNKIPKRINEITERTNMHLSKTYAKPPALNDWAASQPKNKDAGMKRNEIVVNPSLTDRIRSCAVIGISGNIAIKNIKIAFLSRLGFFQRRTIVITTIPEPRNHSLNTGDELRNNKASKVTQYLRGTSPATLNGKL